MLGVGLLLTVGTGLFVASEFALVNLDRADLEARREAGESRLSLTISALRITSTHLSSAQLGITLTTLLFGELLAGAVLTEQVFTIPGFGKLIVDAVFNRDYGVVQGVVLCTAIGFILMNLLADVLYILVNPRLRTG